MDTTHLVLLFLAVGVIAFLYSSVGHAGASGYIATMTLFGLATTVIRPTALVLNILVASIGTFQFWRARLRPGSQRWDLQAGGHQFAGGGRAVRYQPDRAIRVFGDLRCAWPVFP